ncbi:MULTISPECIES: histone-like nucleoid-structuring protein Lsr2 [Cellulomonas]|uniref:histone-like nucleoid-structuring protein Lsr2 n=1 Tax=Cellulomonas TaxID=1707 RepID=UPI0010A93A16|nr:MULTISPECIES: Lsr2 family protein [Cellulomonas]
MAQKVQVLLVDDVDGGTADETVTFGLDGVTYEIDLTAENAAKLRDALAPWVGHGRRVGGRSSSGRSSSGRSSSGSSSSRSARANEAQEIREWAKENGYQVSERGRISAEVRQAYDAAH